MVIDLKTQILRVDELKLVEKFYPREMVDWRVVATYNNALKVGAKFPPIVVGKVGRDFVVIDGWHRVKAFKMNKQEFIEAEILDTIDEKELFIEAVKRNIPHGRPFSIQDRVNIHLKLEKMHIDKMTIEKILMMPIANIEKISSGRVAFTSSGKEFVLKQPMSNMAGKTLPDSYEDLSENIQGGNSQVQLIIQFEKLLENNVLDMSNPRVYGKLVKIYGLLKKVIR